MAAGVDAGRELWKEGKGSTLAGVGSCDLPFIAHGCPCHTRSYTRRASLVDVLGCCKHVGPFFCARHVGPFFNAMRDRHEGMQAILFSWVTCVCCGFLCVQKLRQGRQDCQIHVAHFLIATLPTPTGSLVLPGRRGIQHVCHFVSF